MDLSKRETKSKRVAEINSLYCYKTRHAAKFHQRHQPGEGYPYTERGVFKRAGQGEIYIYHQTVTIDGLTQGITLVTKDKRKSYVEKFFKESVKEIANEKHKLQIFKEAKPKPEQLGIYYMY